MWGNNQEMFQFLISFVLFFLIVVTRQGHRSDLIVRIPQGTIRGTQARSYNNTRFLSFEGIPYAQPPVGDLRFKEPVPAPGWSGTLQADKTYICSQINDSKLIGSEDCLYIYVYVPKTRININDNLDVVVHIHGGSLVGGSPSEMVLPDYLIDKNVIIVTFNYRLGPPGFLSTGDDIVYGNNGFKDQVLALTWIKSNIKYFGGNPESVTITGFSSGGISVQFHYLSPLSRGLFHRGFSSSGTVANPEGLTTIPLEKTKELAGIVNCPTDDVPLMINCLRRAPIGPLVNTSIWFKPVVEKRNPKPFLAEIPYKLLKDKNVYDVPWIASDVVNESMFSLGDLFRNRSQIFEICNTWQDWAREWLDLNEYVDEDKMNFTLQKIKEKYLNNCKNITAENGPEKINRLLTDRHFLYGTEISIRLQSAATKSPVYYYLFKYVPEDRLEFDGPPAASHGVDSKLIIKWTSNPPTLERRDKKMMRLLTDFVARYAKNSVAQIGNTKWNPLKKCDSSLNILEINSPESIRMINVDRISPLKFWESLPIKENSHLLQL